MNDRLTSPEWLNYYQGVIRHNVLERDKIASLEIGDKFTFKNADHAQLISDISMFSRAGKLQDFIDTIDKNIQVFNTNDAAQVEQLASDVRALATNANTETNIFQNLTDQQIVDHVVAHNRDLRANIDGYQETMRNLSAVIGNRFSEQGFEEMVYLFSQVDNFESRYQELSQETIDLLSNLKVRGLNRKKFPVRIAGEAQSLTLDEILEAAKTDPQIIREFIYGSRNEAGEVFEGNQYMQNLLNNKIAQERLIPEILRVQERDINQEIQRIEKQLGRKNASVTKVKNRLQALKDNRKALKNVERAIREQTPDAHNILNNLGDLARIEDARSRLVNTYNRFVGQPHILEQQLEQDQETAQTQQENIVNRDIRDRLNEVQNIADVREIVNEERNNNRNINNVIDSMSRANNPHFNQIVADYKRLEGLTDRVNGDRSLYDESDGVASGVIKLFEKLKGKSDNYTEVLNSEPTQKDLDNVLRENPSISNNDVIRAKEVLQDILEDIRIQDTTDGVLGEVVESIP